MNNNFPSICIPRILGEIKYYDVRNVFEKLFGKNNIDRVDIIKKENERGEYFNKVFIHLKQWPNNNSRLETIRKKLLDGGNIKIVYNDHLFWKCFALKY